MTDTDRRTEPEPSPMPEPRKPFDIQAMVDAANAEAERQRKLMIQRSDSRPEPSPMSETETTPAVSMPYGMRVQREELYGGEVRVTVMPFLNSNTLTLSVNKYRELGSDRWRPAEFSVPITRFETIEQVATYGRALLLLSEIGAELDAEFR